MRRMMIGSTNLVAVAMVSLWLAAPVAYARSAADCAAEADRAVRSQGSTLGGASRGAVRGALFGAIVGGQDSAGKGAALGGIVGAAKRNADNERRYVEVYDACMWRIR